jgi:hypothetical protein
MSFDNGAALACVDFVSLLPTNVLALSESLRLNHCRPGKFA